MIDPRALMLYIGHVKEQSGIFETMKGICLLKWVQLSRVATGGNPSRKNRENRTAVLGHIGVLCRKTTAQCKIHPERTENNKHVAI